MSGDSDLEGRVLAFLASAEIAYSVVRHDPVFTSEQAAAVRRTPLEEGAKTLLCLADGLVILIVVPADRRLGRGAFKRSYQVKDLRMAPTKEVERVGAVPGGIPPFGSLMGMRTYADEELGRRTTLSFNAGSRSTSVILAAADYLRLEKPIVGRFSTPAQ